MPLGTIIVIAAGLVSALFSTAAVFGSGLGLLLAYFALMPILLIGLSRGRQAVNFTTLCGVISAFVLSSPYQGILYCATIALPAWLIVHTALTPQTKNKTKSNIIPIGEIISRLVFLSAIILIASIIIFLDKPSDVALAVETFLKKIIAYNRPDAIITTNDQILVERVVPVFPVIVVSSWLLMAFINAVVAQAILIKAGINIKAAFSYSRINVPEWLYWALSGSVASILFGSENIEYIGRNLSLVFLIPFLFIGLSVIHKIANQFRSPTLVLITFYVLMVISSWPTYMAVMLGFFEKWTNFRKKIKPRLPKD
jgi:uncharacterized protein YybS (DUF2232 family)